MNQFSKYVEAPFEGFREQARLVDQHPIMFNVSFDNAVDIIYQRMEQYTFFDKIGLTPLAILTYCGYRFWTEFMQAPHGHVHDDLWVVIDEDLDNYTFEWDDTSDVSRHQQDKKMAYLEAVQKLVNEVYPFFSRQLDSYMTANHLYTNIDPDADLQITGLFGHVVNITLLVNV